MKDNLPLISVCMPAYNAEKYIKETIESVLNQTYPNIELIVVNDGSLDSTPQVLETYTKKGVKVFHCQNKGAAATRNFAYQQSSGDYIKFMDADDLISPEMVEAQVAKLDGSTKNIASAEWGRFYQDDLFSFRLNPEEVWQDMPAIDWMVESLHKGPNMMQPGIFLIPRTLLEISGLWDERLSLIDDFEFMSRVILIAEGIKFTPGAKLYYRSGIVHGSLSGQKSCKAMESAWLSTDLGCTHILKKENSERTRKICADTYQLWAYNFYPEFPDLVAKAEHKVKELGGSEYGLPGGSTLNILQKVVGWKMAKKLKIVGYRLGYKPELFL